jgi:Domain of unknown function (DUF4371)
MNCSLEDGLRNVIVNQQLEDFSATCNVFRTAYYIAQNDRPYLDYPELIDLQRLNGADVGRLLHSNVVCVDIVDHIASQMKSNIINEIVNSGAPFSVSVDESTSLSDKTCLIIYLRWCPPGSDEAVSIFLDLVALDNGNAAAIVSSLLASLHANGIDEEVLSRSWLGFGTDGAAVMMGTKNGVAAALKQKFPSLIGWHCFNHRLELGVHDAIKACSEVNYFKMFIEKLYCIFSVSPKNRRYLEKCASNLSVELLKIGKVLDVRWVASSLRTVRAVWVSYVALSAHFSKAATDNIFDYKDRATFSGLSTKLQSKVFLLNLALMYDALQELADLSEALQCESITLPKANNLIQRQIEVFRARKDVGGPKYNEAYDACNSGMFRNVNLFSGSENKQICPGRFYQALIDSLSSRLLSNADKPVCECLDILLPSSWPTDLTPEYAETELVTACEHFLVPYCGEMKQAYRDYKQSKGSLIVPKMQQLLAAIATLPISTAECERGFSRMNIICTPLRSRLSVAHMSSLIFISSVGPPVNKFMPASYVRSWFAKGRRVAESTRGMERTATGDARSSKRVLWGFLE